MLAREIHGGVLRQLFAIVSIATAFENDPAAIDLDAEVAHAARCLSPDGPLDRDRQSFGFRKGFRQRIVRRAESLCNFAKSVFHESCVHLF